MSGRPQFAKKKITVEAPATHPVATPLVIKLIPYAFGVLMAFGFAHLQTGRPSRAKSAKAAVEKELRTTSPYASPILETVRSASNKR